MVSSHQLERSDFLSARKRGIRQATHETRAGGCRIHRRTSRSAKIWLAGGPRVPRRISLESTEEVILLILAAPIVFPTRLVFPTSLWVADCSLGTQLSLNPFSPSLPFISPTGLCCPSGREPMKNMSRRASLLVAAAVLAACAAPQ